MPELPPGALTTQGPAVLWCVWMRSEFGASVTKLWGWLIPSVFLVSAAWTAHLEDLKPLSCFWRSLPPRWGSTSLIKPILQPAWRPLTHVCAQQVFPEHLLCARHESGDTSMTRQNSCSSETTQNTVFFFLRKKNLDGVRSAVHKPAWGDGGT